MKHKLALALAAAALVAQCAWLPAYAQSSVSSLPTTATADGSGHCTPYAMPQFPSDCTANSFLSNEAQTTQNSDAQTKDLAISYFNFLKIVFSLTNAQAAGIVGNLMHESGDAQGLNSGWQVSNGNASIGPAGSFVSATDYNVSSGIAGWAGQRKDNLISISRHSATIPCQANPASSLVEQPAPDSSQVANFGFLLTELQCDGLYSQAVAAVKKTSNLPDAVCAFQKGFELPQVNDYSARLQMANNVMTWIGQSPASDSGSSACAATVATSGGGSGGGSGSGSGSGSGDGSGGGSSSGSNSGSGDPSTTTTTTGNDFSNGTVGSSTLIAAIDGKSIAVSALPPLSLPGLSLTSAQTTVLTPTQEQQLAIYYVGVLSGSFGISVQQAEGIVGSMVEESCLNSGLDQALAGGACSQQGITQNPTGLGNDVVNGTGYGLAQWGEDRLQGLSAYAKQNGVPISSVAANIGWLLTELSASSYSSVIDKIKSGDNSTDCTDHNSSCYIWTTQYEQASDTNIGGRNDGVQQVLAWMGN